MPIFLTPRKHRAQVSIHVASVYGRQPCFSCGDIESSHAAAAAAKFLEKKKEFDAVSAFQRASALYLQRSRVWPTTAKPWLMQGKVIECGHQLYTISRRLQFTGSA
ncbi:hypothetical protein B0H12DRAFT_636502 [Mycena haematopus]|nr:hypothetical protein B0H12DRAFT_636502 [Mycena haematopus]